MNARNSVRVTVRTAHFGGWPTFTSEHASRFTCEGCSGEGRAAAAGPPIGLQGLYVRMHQRMKVNHVAGAKLAPQGLMVPSFNIGLAARALLTILDIMEAARITNDSL